MGGFGRFVEDLLRGRAIRRWRGRRRLDAGQDAELRTAILLRSVRPGADSAAEDFLSDLRNRLATEFGAAPRPLPATRRRRFVQVAGVAAASTAIGVGLDRVVSAPEQPDQPQQEAQPRQEAQPALVPDNGTWHTVLSSAELPEGVVRSFELDAVAGFVRRDGGKVAAVSGSCTHLGCRLMLDPAAQRLNCPCHRASFTVTGAVLAHRLPIALPPLPILLVREHNGAVQVFLPHA